jgi:hypothetical protein
MRATPGLQKRYNIWFLLLDDVGNDLEAVFTTSKNVVAENS